MYVDDETPFNAEEWIRKGNLKKYSEVHSPHAKERPQSQAIPADII
jgi:hypothetical protein